MIWSLTARKKTHFWSDLTFTEVKSSFISFNLEANIKFLSSSYLDAVMLVMLLQGSQNR